MKKVHSGDNTVQSVDRTLSILEAMADEGRPMTLSEISNKLSLNISTVHRLLKTLINRDFACQDINTGKYQLGTKTFRIGNAALYSLDIRTVARPYLKKAAEICGETVNMAILDSGYVLYIDQVESKKMVKMVASLGRRAPAHCNAVGKVLLAGLGEHELERFFKTIKLDKYTDKTITAPLKLRQELKEIRKKGYAYDLEEMETGIRCVAAPVRNFQGEVFAAIGISAPKIRISMKNTEYFGEIVQKIAADISAEMGYRNGR